MIQRLEAGARMLSTNRERGRAEFGNNSLAIVIDLTSFKYRQSLNEPLDDVEKLLSKLWQLLDGIRSNRKDINPNDLQELKHGILIARTLLNKLDHSPNLLVNRRRIRLLRVLSRIDRIAGRLPNAQNPNIDVQPVRLRPLNALFARAILGVFVGSISFMPFGKASAQDGHERKPHPTLIVGSDAPGNAGVQSDIIGDLLAEIESTLGDFEEFSYSVENIVKAKRAPEFGTTAEDIEDYLINSRPKGGDQPLSQLAEIKNNLGSISSTAWRISSSIFDRFKNGTEIDTSNELSSLPEPSPEQERGSLNPVVNISVKLEQPVNVNPVSFSLEYDQENGVFIKLLNDQELSIDALRADEQFNTAYLELIEQINLISEADPTVSSQAFSILVTSNSEIGRLGTTDNFNLAIMTSDVAERYGVAKNALLVVSTIDGVEQIVLAASPDGGTIVPIDLESDVPGYSNLTWADNFNLENATGTAWISINEAGSPTYILFRNETGKVVWLPLVPKQSAALTSIEASSYAAQIVIPRPNINIRTEANTRSNSLGLTTGTEELLLDPSRPTVNDGSFDWLPILYDGIPGWIRDDVVLETKSINSVSHETNVEITAGTYDRAFVSRFFSEALAAMPEQVTIHYIVNGQEESQEVSVDQNLFIIDNDGRLIMLVQNLNDANGGPVPAAIWENGQLVGYEQRNGEGDLTFWTELDGRDGVVVVEDDLTLSQDVERTLETLGEAGDSDVLISNVYQPNPYLTVYETGAFSDRYPEGVENPLFNDEQVWQRMRVVLLAEIVKDRTELSPSYEQVSSDFDYYLSLVSDERFSIPAPSYVISGSSNGSTISVNNLLDSSINILLMGNNFNGSRVFLDQNIDSTNKAIVLDKQGRIFFLLYRNDLDYTDTHERLNGISLSNYIVFSDLFATLCDRSLSLNFVHDENSFFNAYYYILEAYIIE